MNGYRSGIKLGKQTSLLMILVLALFSTYCSSGGGKKRGSNPPFTPTPAPTSSPDPDDDVDIDDDDITDVETGNSSLTTTLNLTTSGNTIGGSAYSRQASEYLLVVRAATNSCIRIKVASNSLQGQDDVASENDVGTGSADSCSDSEDTSSGEETSGGDEGSGLNLLNFGQRSPSTPSFSLVGDTLCSTRLFRMKAGETIRTKTGRMAYRHSFSIGGQTRYVRVWVDDEISTTTCNGTGMDDKPRLAYAPLWGSGYNGWYDRFLQAHVRYLAENTAEAYRKLADTYEDISDVDHNNGLDVFVSPDVNRTYFNGYLNGRPNAFEIEPIYKPQDLAAFDTTKNPTSNEGEIIYMWAPDPAGAYKTFSYPSSSSLTSDYARGAIGYQLMNLIWVNQRLIANKFKLEEDWLRESLSLLGSTYVGGNDFTFKYTAHYLSSQPQILSLNNGAGTSDFGAFSGMEARGFRLMFAWYLHARLCGTSLAPCAELLDILESNTTGKATIEAVTGRTFNQILENYGVSVGVALADDPDAAKAFWNSAPADYPEAPFDMPKADFINPGPTPGSNKTKIVDLPSAANISTGDVDPDNPVPTAYTLLSQTISGPFTSRDSELFQPVFPDYEVNLDLEENSVTFILLTGLIDQETAARAIFGKNLKVVIVPLGEMNTDAIKPAGTRRTRILHTEKVDENNFLNTSPINLTTQSVDRSNPAQAFTNPNIVDIDMQIDFRHPRRLHYNPVAYPDLVATRDFIVSKDKDLWIAGTIENGTVTVSGAETPVGDTDSYVIEANPCEGLTGPALTTCQGQSHNLVLQLSSRIFETKIEPMFLVTANDMDLFRGKQIVRSLEDAGGDLGSRFPAGEDEVQVICESAGQYPALLTAADICANGGTLAEDTVSPQLFYDNWNYRHPNNLGFFSSTFDNYLYAAPLGYPFVNAWNIARDEEDGPSERAHYLDFAPEEKNRSFLSFKYDASLTPKTFKFYPYQYSGGDPLAGGTDGVEALTDDQIDELNLIKAYLGGLGSEPIPADEDFVAACANYVEDEDDCDTPFANRASIVAEILSFLDDGEIQKVIYCSGTTIPCPNVGVINSVVGPLVSWNVPNAAFVQAAGSYKTYYKPIYSISGSGPCRSNTSSDPTASNQFCLYSTNSDFVMNGGDIRENFPLASSEIKFCGDSTSCDPTASNFKIGIDYLSYRESVIDPSPVYRAKRQLVTGEVFPVIGGTNDARVGEMKGKTGLLHYQEFAVPGTGALIHVIVGGKDLSEGKYLLRARYKDFDVALPASDLY